MTFIVTLNNVREELKKHSCDSILVCSSIHYTYQNYILKFLLLCSPSEFHCLLCCVLLMSFIPSLLCVTSLLQVALPPCYALASFITPLFCVTSLLCACWTLWHLFSSTTPTPLWCSLSPFCYTLLMFSWTSSCSFSNCYPSLPTPLFNVSVEDLFTTSSTTNPTFFFF